MYNYNKTQDSLWDRTEFDYNLFYFASRNLILYQVVVIFSKGLFLLMTLCTFLMKITLWLMKILVVVLSPTLKLRQKSDSSTENRKTFPDAVKHLSALRVLINRTVLWISSLPKKFCSICTIHGMWMQQLSGHSTKLLIGILCSMSTFQHQLIILEQTHNRCFLHCDRWTVEGRDCTPAIHSFRENTYLTHEWTKQLLRLRSWVIIGSPEQWMEFHRLRWFVDVFKCRFFF